MKTEALKLADELQDYMTSLGWKTHQAPDMIRRLVEELDRNKIYIQKMEDALGCDVSYYEPLNKPVNPFAWVDDCFSFFTDDDYSMLDDELKEGMIPLYTHPQTKPLSDEEIDIIKYAVGSAICSLESEINEQEKTFKGYEHCSNLSGLREELNDCLKAKDILERHGIK